MTIDSAVVRILEQQQLVRNVSVDKFPYTKDQWYKCIFWPVHANGGDEYLNEQYGHVNTPPYAKLATTMRATIPKMGFQRGSTIYPRTTKITEQLGRSLSSLELRKAPDQFDFDFITHHYQCISVPSRQN